MTDRFTYAMLLLVCPFVWAVAAVGLLFYVLFGGIAERLYRLGQAGGCG